MLAQLKPISNHDQWSRSGQTDSNVTVGEMFCAVDFGRSPTSNEEGTAFLLFLCLRLCVWTFVRICKTFILCIGHSILVILCSHISTHWCIKPNRTSSMLDDILIPLFFILSDTVQLIFVTIAFTGDSLLVREAECEPPHKIDENMWKNREQIEEIIYLLESSHWPKAVRNIVVPYIF